MKDLHIYEEVLLLALRDDEGTFTDGFIEIAVAGAILAELLLDGHIYIGEKKRNLIDHDDPAQTGDPVIDEVLDKITVAKRRAALINWIPRLSRIPKLRTKVARQLCKRGIVKTDEDKVLFLFPRTIYPEINPKPEKEIMKRLRAAIFENRKSLDPKTVTLISIAHRTGLLKHNFGSTELQKRKKRINQIVEGEITGAATGDFLGVGDSAATAVALIPALIGGSVSS